MRINEARRAELERTDVATTYDTIAELIDHKNDLLEENKRLRKFLLNLHTECLVALI
jgi:hypothetical protein